VTITITEQDLVEIPKGTVTEDGIKKHQCWYFIYGSLVKRSWRCGYNLMEDACRNFKNTSLAMAA
jgi:hypothetical protein